MCRLQQPRQLELDEYAAVDGAHGKPSKWFSAWRHWVGSRTTVRSHEEADLVLFIFLKMSAQIAFLFSLISFSTLLLLLYIFGGCCRGCVHFI